MLLPKPLRLRPMLRIPSRRHHPLRHDRCALRLGLQGHGMPCPYKFCLVILRGNAIVLFRCCANRLKSKNFFIREIRSGPGSRAIRAIRKWRRSPTRRGIDFGPVQFNLCSTAHWLLLFISVLSVSSVLKSEKTQHRDHRESQRTTEKSKFIPQLLPGGPGALGLGAGAAFEFAYANPIARKCASACARTLANPAGFSIRAICPASEFAQRRHSSSSTP